MDNHLLGPELWELLSFSISYFLYLAVENHIIYWLMENKIMLLLYLVVENNHILRFACGKQNNAIIIRGCGQ